jgi:hypothetical protein
MFHAAEDFDGIGIVVVRGDAVVSSDGSQASVFRFRFYDGGIDLFGGHSTPWSTLDFVWETSCERKLRLTHKNRPAQDPALCLRNRPQVIEI